MTNENLSKNKKNITSNGLLWFFESFIWLGVLLLVADFVSKQIVLHLMKVGDQITLIPGFLSIQYVVNDGMAFGLEFRSPLVSRIIFVSISIIGSIALLLVYIKKFNSFNKFSKAALMLMSSGCIGNLIDRAFYSAKFLNYETNGVVDWIAFDFGKYSFPRFNIADSCLVIGTFMIIGYLIYAEAKEGNKTKRIEDEKNKGKVMSMIEKQRLEDEEKTRQENIMKNNVDQIVKEDKTIKDDNKENV